MKSFHRFYAELEMPLKKSFIFIVTGRRVNDRVFSFGITSSSKIMITVWTWKQERVDVEEQCGALYSTVHSGSWLDGTVIKAYHRGCICRLPWPKHFPLMDGHFHCLLTLNEACSSGLNWMLSTVSSYSPQPVLSLFFSLSEATVSTLFSAPHAPLLFLFLRPISDELWLKRAEPNTHIFTHTV